MRYDLRGHLESIYVLMNLYNYKLYLSIYLPIYLCSNLTINYLSKHLSTLSKFISLSMI